MADCLFCGITAGKIPSGRVREAPRTIAFRDISPQASTGPRAGQAVPHAHAHELGWPPG
jgi:histidine triad (HIT) family protein